MCGSGTFGIQVINLTVSDGLVTNRMTDEENGRTILPGRTCKRLDFDTIHWNDFMGEIATELSANPDGKNTVLTEPKRPDYRATVS
jgi:hypothetical protein